MWDCISVHLPWRDRVHCAIVNPSKMIILSNMTTLLLVCHFSFLSLFFPERPIISNMTALLLVCHFTSCLFCFRSHFFPDRAIISKMTTLLLLFHFPSCLCFFLNGQSSPIWLLYTWCVTFPLSIEIMDQCISIKSNSTVYCKKGTVALSWHGRNCSVQQSTQQAGQYCIVQ